MQAKPQRTKPPKAHPVKTPGAVGKNILHANFGDSHPCDYERRRNYRLKRLLRITNVEML